MSDFVQPQGWQPTRLRRPWDSPGKNSGVGCHFLLQRMKVKPFSRVQLLRDLQPTRVLRPWAFPGKSMEWGAIAFSTQFLDQGSNLGSHSESTEAYPQDHQGFPDKSLKKKKLGEFPGGPVVRTWCVYCCGPGFDP